jgi:hypothetical protein
MKYLIVLIGLLCGCTNAGTSRTANIAYSVDVCINMCGAQSLKFSNIEVLTDGQLKSCTCKDQ